jgi:hypothetical protein
MTVVWKFAAPPPEPNPYPLPECPDWEKGMTNEVLAQKFEACRQARDVGAARVRLWEDWVKGELEAQRKGRE